MSDFLKELLTVFVISTVVAFGQIITAGYPGTLLTEFYEHLFQQRFPTSLELGGLFIAIVLSFCYPFGAVWGYLFGFRLAPLFFDLQATVKWIIGAIVFFLWTIFMFELGYRWALQQADKLK